jgi:predicted metal-dependent HD superfamily phosphohydrolase
VAASAQLHDAPGLAARLDAWYGAPTRHYHGLAHLLAFLGCWKDAMAARVPGAHDDPVTFAAALLLHDAIYDVRRTDNEAASAALAHTVLPQHFPAADVRQVEALILATGTHAFARADADALPDAMALFLDCDLAALGADPATYVAYAYGVAAEYVPVVGRWRYRFGRSRFLGQLVRRPRLYHTAHFHATRDAAARRHLAAEARAWRRWATLDSIEARLREALGIM